MIRAIRLRLANLDKPGTARERRVESCERRVTSPLCCQSSSATPCPAKCDAPKKRLARIGSPPTRASLAKFTAIRERTLTVIRTPPWPLSNVTLPTSHGRVIHAHNRIHNHIYNHIRHQPSAIGTSTKVPATHLSTNVCTPACTPAAPRLCCEGEPPHCV
jgi:hypothetical protein